MKIKVVLKFLSLIIALVSFCMIFPFLWAVRDHTTDSKAFLLSMAIGAVTAAVMYEFSKNARHTDMGTREAFAAVSFSWIFASLIGCLPYLLGGYVPSLADAYFETMSGFTTTGASILTNVAANPRGILMWRAETQWLGGMGIVVLVIALLPVLGGGLNRLFQAESPGPVLEKTSPTINDMAKNLWYVYIGLTVVGVLLLMAGGMNLFDSICHMFATVSTGGFSTRNASVAAYNSAYIDWTLTIIMFLSGANFSLHLTAVTRRTLKPYKDEEFIFYGKVVLLSTAAIAICLYAHGAYKSVIDTIRYAAFQVVSIMTTTGFVTANYDLWPPFTQVILLLLMIIGGCAGSTAGAIKCVRANIMLKSIKAEIKHLIHPNAVIAISVDGNALPHERVTSTVIFVLTYLLLFAAAVLITTATGQDIVTALGAVATTLGNVGPGLGKVGPIYNFESQTDIAKWLFSFCMLCGRLELFTVLVLFSRDTWRR